MQDDHIRLPEFDRAFGNLQKSIEDLRSDLNTFKEDVGSRLDSFDERRQSDLIAKISRSREEGILEGRIWAIEERMTRQDNWRLATIAPGLVALALLAIEWFKGGK